MEILEAIKFVTLLVLEAVVIAAVGAVLIAGLYQLVRDQVRAVREKLRASRVPTSTAVQKPAKRF
jgi:Na+-translocating ferredoxin:NAD+ oxidoreductase RnfG subunit